MILGRILRDGRIDSPGDRSYCIAAKYDGIKNAGLCDLCAPQQKTSPVQPSIMKSEA
jgi:hypothetical protein